MAECDNCRRPEARAECSQCRSAVYCGRKCQVAAWKKHKADCAMLTQKYAMLHIVRAVLQTYAMPQIRAIDRSEPAAGGLRINLERLRPDRIQDSEHSHGLQINVSGMYPFTDAVPRVNYVYIICYHRGDKMYFTVSDRDKGMPGDKGLLFTRAHCLIGVHSTDFIVDNAVPNEYDPLWLDSGLNHLPIAARKIMRTICDVFVCNRLTKACLITAIITYEALTAAGEVCKLIDGFAIIGGQKAIKHYYVEYDGVAVDMMTHINIMIDPRCAEFSIRPTRTAEGYARGDRDDAAEIRSLNDMADGYKRYISSSGEFWKQAPVAIRKIRAEILS